MPCSLDAEQESLETMRAQPAVSIISNSWGDNVYPDQSRAFDPQREYSTYYYRNGDYLRSWMASNDTEFDTLVDLLEDGRLLLFAAGNEGHLSPGGESALPAIKEKYADPNDPDQMADARAVRLGLLSISAFDSQYYDPESYNPNEGLSPAFVAVFTNMGLYSEANTLWAPGVRVYSTFSPDTYGYEDGTSMATPYAAGVAALTKSAFPYMNGKALADVLLSTATPFSLDGASGTLKVPGVFVLNREEYDEYEDLIGERGTISAYALKGHKPTKNEMQAMIDAIRVYYSRDDWNDAYVQGLLDAALQSVTELEPDEYLSLFGAGVIDAGKAVRGPGYFDAYRLGNDDKDTFGGLEYALYPVDSMGYDSVWSNNIGQVIVDAAGEAGNYYYGELAGLAVGLRKRGAGVLYLTGDNSFTGPTVAEGGAVSLGIAGQDDDEARLAGDVYVLPQGAFTGNGYVAGNLAFAGRLLPGLADTPGSALTVRGSVTGSYDGTAGELRFALFDKGKANSLKVDDGVDLEGTRITIQDRPGSAPMLSGSYTLIQSGTTISGTPANTRLELRQGSTLKSHLTLQEEGGQSPAGGMRLLAVYGGSSALPGAKALAEGYLGGAVLVGQGGDLIADKGIDAAVRSAGVSGGVAGFGMVSAAHLRYNTGSHVDMHSVSLLTGLAKGLDVAPGRLTLGAFFEYGNGSYSTSNSFSNAASVYGDGHTYYVGGGALGRLELGGLGFGQWYVEGSARAGTVHNEYDSSDLQDAVTGLKAEYDASSPYYGLHVGLGQIWALGRDFSLDMYGKYFWTRQEGDSANLSTGERLRFKSVDSQRARLGGKLNWEYNEHFASYVGAAWEHEFDGKARATTNGQSIASPELEGDTGVGELGVSIRPSAAVPMTFDFGVQGYLGQREGVTGTLQLRFDF
jgi:autotransporter-associated beta strand protein